MDSFLYRWYDKLSKKYYIGTHKGSPDDGYVCSSKLMLEEYEKRPSDFSREILMIGSYEDIILEETKLLKEVDAARSHEYYNMHNGDGKFYNKGHSEQTKNKLKIARNKRTDKPRLGKPLSQEGKKKASLSAKKRLMTLEGKNNVSRAGKISAQKRAQDPNYSKIQSERVKKIWEKRRQGLLPLPKSMKNVSD